MKVRDLRTLLQQLPDDHEIILAADREGDRFNTVDSVMICEHDQDGQLFWDDPSSHNAIVIWPAAAQPWEER